MDNKELLTKCSKDDPRAWGLFLDRYTRTIYWSIEDRLSKYRVEHTQSDIDDIYQEVVVSIWEKKKLKKLKDPDKIEPWLITVAGNKALDYYKVKRRRQGISVSLFENIYKDENAESTFEDVLRSAQPDPLQQAQAKEIEEIVGVFINSLEENEKNILTLNMLLGKKHRDVAYILKMPEATVSTVIARTKKSIQEKLEKKGISSWIG